jgi:hypothetical protein
MFVTEPSAVAPDARVDYGDDSPYSGVHREKRGGNLHLTSRIEHRGAAALGSEMLASLRLTSYHYQPTKELPTFQLLHQRTVFEQKFSQERTMAM